MPGQLPAEVDLLADKVEERRLKRMGVLRDLLEEEQDFEVLALSTTGVSRQGGSQVVKNRSNG